MKKISNMITTPQLVGLIILAYIFSFGIRLIWVYQFQDNPNFFWNDQLMINTNDGYYFASGVQQALLGMHEENIRIPDIFGYSLVFFSTLMVNVFSLSIETVILYLSAIVSSLVVIPIILIAKLYNKPLWGFLAALLGSITWSYYNRTMIGYYDTDMFSAMAPMLILYFLIKSTIYFNIRSAFYAAIMIALFPFLYDQGKAIVYAMGIIYAVYLIWYHRDDKTTYMSLLLVFLALMPFYLGRPEEYIAHLIAIVLLYVTFLKISISQKHLKIIFAIIFILFLILSNVFGVILDKVFLYIETGTKLEGLHFYSVTQTVREAGQIPFSTFANRISGSGVGLILSIIGYIMLVIKHRAFILALPLIGIGGFALFGGLRFTVYAVPIAAMSSIYFFFILGSFFKNEKFKYLFIVFATATMLYPNIIHIIGYKVPTVLNRAEVEDLNKLKNISNPKDYTLSWWDYGYPIWYYSETSTLIDGGKHQNDNFFISKIMQTTSPVLAANLSRVIVESYVSIDKDSNVSTVADSLLKNKQKGQLNPNSLLSDLEDEIYMMPEKTRDIYIYLPYKMMNIFPTVSVFGNLDLTTGEKERKVSFYPTQAVSNNQGMITFGNGIVFDAKKGQITLGKQKKSIKYFIVTQNTKDGKVRLQSQLYHADGEYAIVYMKSYGRFVVMDSETFNSMYVQMFILEKYDQMLFELVISSPYSKIYKLKI